MPDGKQPVNGPLSTGDIQQFLTALWPNDLPASTWGYFWTLQDKNSFSFDTISKAMQLAEVANILAGSDAYLGMGVVERPYQRHERPGNTSVRYLPAYWLDIDAKNGVTPQQCLALIDTLLEPTMVVFTGGGYHAYWCFKQPVPTPQWDGAGFYYAMTQDAPIPVDKLADPARILRVPGTFNYKFNPPRRAHIVHCNGPRYSLDELPTIKPPSVGQSFDLGGGIPASGGPLGGRNITLHKWLASERGKYGFNQEQLLLLARAFNEVVCSPRLPDKEVEATARSVMRYLPNEERRAAQIQAAEKQVSSNREKWR